MEDLSRSMSSPVLSHPGDRILRNRSFIYEPKSSSATSRASGLDSVSDQAPARTESVQTSAADLTDDTTSFLVLPTRRQQHIILAVGWVTTFQIIGLSQAYGVFQSFHTDHIGDTGALITDKGAIQRGAIALIGSLSSSSISLMLGILMTPILDRTKPETWCFGERSGVTYLMGSGALILALGYFLAATSTQLWQLVLFHGIVVGLGGAFMFYPVQTISSEYFQSKTALAAGFIASGASIGGLVYSPIIHHSLDSIGIKNTYYILAVSNLVIGAILALVTPPPRPTISERKFLPKSIWRQPSFYLMNLGSLAYQMVLNQPVIFGPDFTRTLGYSTSFAAIWLATLNGIGAPTRIALGWIGDRTSRQATLMATLFIAVLSSLSWLASSLLSSRAFFWIFTVTYGSMASGFNQFMGPVLLEVFGSEVYFGVNAAVSFSRGIGSLLGTPIGGALLGSREGREDVPKGYFSLAVFTGSMLLFQFVCSATVWFLSWRRREVS